MAAFDRNRWPASSESAAKPKHLLIASTSSVYGGNEKMPFEEADRTDFPVSLYAATKKACEAMSHSYAHLFRIPTTCFRFFTVYGPWGRPDMALFKFVSAIEAGQPIEVYGEGNMRRDFTYVDDLVEGVVRLIGVAPEEGKPFEAPGVVDSLSPVAPWRVVNIGGGQPVGLMPFIETIEEALGKSAEKIMLPMQQGDVTETYADPGLLQALTTTACSRGPNGVPFASSGTAAGTRVPHDGQRTASRRWRSTNGLISGSSILSCALTVSAARSPGRLAQQQGHWSGRCSTTRSTSSLMARL